MSALVLILPYSLPSLWKIRERISQLSPFDHATWQHARENPQHVLGSRVDICPEGGASCSKNSKIVPYHRCAQIPRLITVSVPDYGSCFGSMPPRYRKTRWRIYAYAYSYAYRSAFSLEISISMSTSARRTKTCVLLVLVLCSSSPLLCLCLCLCRSERLKLRLRRKRSDLLT